MCLAMRLRTGAGLGALAVVCVFWAGPARAFGQAHGITVTKQCVSPVADGDTLECDIVVSYNDGFGDSWKILDAWDVVDPDGANVRVPAVGNLPVLQIFGNARFDGVPGQLPVIIGIGGSVLNGLPGMIQPGVVVIVQDTYVVGPDDPDPLPDLAFVRAIDVCDDPNTLGCFSVPLLFVVGAVSDLLGDVAIDLVIEPPVCDWPAGTAQYVCTVTNPGDVVLTDVLVTTDDPGCPLLLLDSGDGNMNGLLDVGETWIYICPAPVPQFTDVTVTVTGLDVLLGTLAQDEEVLEAACDCNDNGLSDAFDIEFAISDDCDGNGRPDECEPDCNGNGVADACDLSSGTSEDCNGNGIPDECEPDSNGDGVIDDCDCNGNGIFDDVELATNPEVDCDGDGQLDDCVVPFTGAVRWQGGATEFLACASWDPPFVPHAPNSAFFDVPGGNLVTFERDEAVGRLVVNDGDVTLDLGGFALDVGSAIAPGIVVGEASGDVGALLVDGGDVIAVSGRVGSGGGATGTLAVSGAAHLGFAEDFCIGCAGDGSLLIDAGGSVVCRDATVGDSAGSFGAVTLLDAGSTWTIPFFVTINNGTLHVGAGTIVTAGFDAFGGIFLFDDAVLTGEGTIDGTIVNFGEVQPGGGGLPLVIDGDYRQVGEVPGLPPSTGVVSVELPGTEEGPGGPVLEVTGTAELGGGLIVTLAPGADPGPGEVFPLVTAASVVDRFDVAFTPGLPGQRYLRIEYAGGPGGVAGPAGDISITVDLLSNLLGFDDPGSVSLAGAPSSVVVANFDEDAEGREDLAIAVPGSNAVFVFLNAITGPMGEFTGFTSTAQVDVGNAPAGVTAGSLDPMSNASLDLAVSNAGDGTVTILLNDGSGVFSAQPAPFAVGNEPRGLAAGDFDGDGIDDLLVANAGSDTLSLLTNDGMAGFPLIATLQAGQSRPTCVDPDDLDNDRCLDAVICNESSDSISVFLNQGNASFEPPVIIPVGDEPTAIAVTDLDQDGLPDVATSNQGDGTVSVVVNQGGGSFAPAVNLPVGPQARSLAVVDLDGDGDGDIAVVAMGDMGLGVRVLRNDTNQGMQLVFAAAQDLDVGSEPLLVAGGDLDGDMSDDLIAVNAGPGPGVAAAGGAGSVNVVLNASANCIGDVNGDGEVDVDDLNAVISDWGTDGSANGGDVTGPNGAPPDGIVKVDDLNAVISGWGACP